MADLTPLLWQSVQQNYLFSTHETLLQMLSCTGRYDSMSVDSTCLHVH